MEQLMKKEQGVVLVIALIALVAMSLAGISLMRTVDTTNLISGNLAFDEAAIQMEDVGVEAALAWINGNPYSNVNGCQVLTTVCPNYYYPDVMQIDANTRLPSPANGAALNWSPSVAAAAGYTVQYVIERMCGTLVGGTSNTSPGGSANPPTFANCMASPVYTSGVVTSGRGRLFFRVTVRVSGPRNTSGLAQYFIGTEDNVN